MKFKGLSCHQVDPHSKFIQSFPVTAKFLTIVVFQVDWYIQYGFSPIFMVGVLFKRWLCWPLTSTWVTRILVLDKVHTLTNYEAHPSFRTTVNLCTMFQIYELYWPGTVLMTFSKLNRVLVVGPHTTYEPESQNCDSLPVFNSYLLWLWMTFDLHHE